jgi:hypothetical protein
MHGEGKGLAWPGMGKRPGKLLLHGTLSYLKIFYGEHMFIYCKCNEKNSYFYEKKNAFRSKSSRQVRVLVLSLVNWAY